MTRGQSFEHALIPWDVV